MLTFSTSKQTVPDLKDQQTQIKKEKRNIFKRLFAGSSKPTIPNFGNKSIFADNFLGKFQEGNEVSAILVNAADTLSQSLVIASKFENDTLGNIRKNTESAIQQILSSVPNLEKEKELVSEFITRIILISSLLGIDFMNIVTDDMQKGIFNIVGKNLQPLYKKIYDLQGIDTEKIDIKATALNYCVSSILTLVKGLFAISKDSPNEQELLRIILRMLKDTMLNAEGIALDQDIQTKQAWDLLSVTFDSCGERFPPLFVVPDQIKLSSGQTTEIDDIKKKISVIGSRFMLAGKQIFPLQSNEIKRSHYDRRILKNMLERINRTLLDLKKAFSSLKNKENTFNLTAISLSEFILNTLSLNIEKATEYQGKEPLLYPKENNIHEIMYTFYLGTIKGLKIGGDVDEWKNKFLNLLNHKAVFQLAEKNKSADESLENFLFSNLDALSEWMELFNKQKGSDMSSVEALKAKIERQIIAISKLSLKENEINKTNIEVANGLIEVAIKTSSTPKEIEELLNNFDKCKETDQYNNLFDKLYINETITNYISDKNLTETLKQASKSFREKILQKQIEINNQFKDFQNTKKKIQKKNDSPMKKNLFDLIISILLHKDSEKSLTNFFNLIQDNGKEKELMTAIKESEENPIIQALFNKKSRLFSFEERTDEENQLIVSTKSTTAGNLLVFNPGQKDSFTFKPGIPTLKVNFSCECEKDCCCAASLGYKGEIYLSGCEQLPSFALLTNLWKANFHATDINTISAKQSEIDEDFQIFRIFWMDDGSNIQTKKLLDLKGEKQDKKKVDLKDEKMEKDKKEIKIEKNDRNNDRKNTLLASNSDLTMEYLNFIEVFMNKLNEKNLPYNFINKMNSVIVLLNRMVGDTSCFPKGKINLLLGSIEALRLFPASNFKKLTREYRKHNLFIKSITVLFSFLKLIQKNADPEAVKQRIESQTNQIKDLVEKINQNKDKRKKTEYTSLKNKLEKQVKLFTSKFNKLAEELDLFRDENSKSNKKSKSDTIKTSNEANLLKAAEKILEDEKLMREVVLVCTECAVTEINIAIKDESPEGLVKRLEKDQNEKKDVIVEIENNLIKQEETKQEETKKVTKEVEVVIAIKKDSQDVKSNSTKNKKACCLIF